MAKLQEYNGQLAGFPEEVVARMLDEQELQGNERDVSVFEKDKTAGLSDKGFSWHRADDGFGFWEDVIRYENFDIFFNRYRRVELADMIPENVAQKIVKQIEKPPLGLIPRWAHDEKRFEDIKTVVIKFIEESRSIQVEWIMEYNELAERILK